MAIEIMNQSAKWMPHQSAAVKITVMKNDCNLVAITCSAGQRSKIW